MNRPTSSLSWLRCSRRRRRLNSLCDANNELPIRLPPPRPPPTSPPPPPSIVSLRPFHSHLLLIGLPAGGTPKVALPTDSDSDSDANLETVVASDGPSTQAHNTSSSPSFRIVINLFVMDAERTNEEGTNSVRLSFLPSSLSRLPPPPSLCTLMLARRAEWAERGT